MSDELIRFHLDLVSPTDHRAVREATRGGVHEPPASDVFVDIIVIAIIAVAAESRRRIVDVIVADDDISCGMMCPFKAGSY